MQRNAFGPELCFSYWLCRICLPVCLHQPEILLKQFFGEDLELEPKGDVLCTISLPWAVLSGLQSQDHARPIVDPVAVRDSTSGLVPDFADGIRDCE